MIVEFEHLGRIFRLSHKEFCMFARAAIMHRAGEDFTQPHAKHHIFGKALRDATRELKQREFQFTELATWAAPVIFGNGRARLDPAELTYLLLSLRYCWLADQPLERVQQIAEAARTRAARKTTGDGARDLRGITEFLRLPPSGEHQATLRRYAGDYFIFRRLTTPLRLSVSHMRITLGKDDAEPATYVTTTLVSDDGSRRDTVRGILHVAPDKSGIIFATGRQEGTGQIRLTILQPRSKLDYNTEDMQLDLAGLRLSLSEGHPEGYHIWCSRLDNDAPPQEALQTLAREYDLVRVETPTEKVVRIADDSTFQQRHDAQPHNWLERHVVGLKEILAYLDDKPIVTM